MSENIGFLKSEPGILPIMFNNNNLTTIAIRKKNIQMAVSYIL